MKKQLLYLFSLLLLATACTPKNEVRQVATHFLSAYYDCNWEATRPYSTYSTQKLVDKKAYYHSLNPYTPSSAYHADIEEVILQKKSNSAIVRYKHQGGIRNLYLSKESGQWKVDMNEERPIELYLGPQSSPSAEDAKSSASSQESEPIAIKDVE